jgi:hypothetical protein
MKLASLRHGRDGKLVVVSDDLAWYAHSGPEVPTLQAALDDWTHAEPRLRAVAEGVNAGTILRERFHEREAASPLPRAYQWADGSAYVNHVALVRQARGAKMPETFWTDPLMYQGGSDAFLGPRDSIPLKDEAWGCDFEAEVAVIVDDCEAGISAAEARKRIRLVMLVNDVSLRNLIPAELEKGFGFFPIEAVVGILTRRGDAGCARRCVARRQIASADACQPQRQSLRRRERRRGHDFRFRPTHRPRRKDARSRSPARSSVRAPCRTVAKMAAPASPSAKAGAAIPASPSSA